MSDVVYPNLPVPNREAVAAWLKRLTPDYLHDRGWIEANRKFHAVAMGGRQFTLANFPDEPDRRSDFLDGMVFGLLALGHFADIDEMFAKLTSDNSTAQKTKSLSTY